MRRLFLTLKLSLVSTGRRQTYVFQHQLSDFHVQLQFNEERPEIIHLQVEMSLKTGQCGGGGDVNGQPVTRQRTLAFDAASYMRWQCDSLQGFADYPPEGFPCDTVDSAITPVFPRSCIADSLP